MDHLVGATLNTESKVMERTVAIISACAFQFISLICYSCRFVILADLLFLWFYLCGEAASKLLDAPIYHLLVLRSLA